MYAKGLAPATTIVLFSMVSFFSPLGTIQIYSVKLLKTYEGMTVSPYDQPLVLPSSCRFICTRTQLGERLEQLLLNS